MYALATFLSSIAWGSIYSFTTRYLAVELGGGTDSVILLLGLSWVFTLTGFTAGRVASLIGERRAILFGSLSILPLIVSMYTRDPFIIAFAISTTAFPWVISWSIILKLVMSTSEPRKAGSRYSMLTIGTGLGYFMGSLIQGLAYGIYGALSVYSLALSLVLASHLIYYYHYPTSMGVYSERAKSAEVKTFSIINRIILPLLSVTFIVFTREFLYSLAPVKLDHSIKEIINIGSGWMEYAIYGLVFSGGALVSPFMRLVSGWLVDKYGSLTIYTTSIVSYTLLFWSFNYTHGLLPIILWQIPLFPLLDTSMNVYFAKLLQKDEMVTGYGILNSFIALGGALVTPLYLLGGINPLIACLIATASSSISLLLLMIYEHSRRGIEPSQASTS